MGSQGRWACTACGGAYTVDGSRGAEDVVLRCVSCGFEEHAALSEDAVTKPLTATTAAVAAQSTRSESRAPAAEPAKTPTPTPVMARSAASMLDDTTPNRDSRRLSLASEPILPPAKRVASSSPPTDATPSGRTIEEMASDELEDAPPSVHDVAKVAAVAAKPASGAPARRSSKPPPRMELAEDDDDKDDDGELVSLKDVQVVGTKTPLPPKAGALRTLPPKGLSAPPPTIEVPSGSKPPPSVATGAKPAKDAKPAKNAKPATSTKPAKERDAAPPASAKSPAAAEPTGGGRSPLTTIALLAAMAFGGWLVVRGVRSDDTNGNASTTGAGAATTTAPSAATPDPAATATTTPPTSATAPATEPDASTVARIDVPVTAFVSGSGDGAASAVATTPTVANAPATGVAAGPAGVNLAGSAAEVLDRAATARRAGELPKARALYTRVLELHPGDVEAHAGLGEIARMNGDLAGAKKAFQDALAASPSFYPALLGLADTLWELGEKSEAQRLYGRILSARDQVPDRVRDRGPSGVSGSGGAAKPSPVPLVTALPPSPPAPPSPAGDDDN